jgi:DNA-binding FadR family transcriptional regulator
MNNRRSIAVARNDDVARPAKAVGVQKPSNRLHSERLSKHVYETILTEIVRGVFAEGDRLPTESALAERFSVSRPVVREALAQLRDDGLIQVRRGSGSYVLQQPSSAMLQFAPLGSIADIQRCFEFRAAIEPAAAALAANRRSDAELAALKAALEALDAAVNAGDLGTEADFAFHRAVAEASGNPFFETTLSSLEEATASAISVNRNLSLLSPHERLLLVQKEHEQVFEEIRTRNAKGAEDAMRAHIEGARRRVFEGERVVKR